MRSSSAFLAATLVAACGTSPDERPKTFEAVTFEVLTPHCGQVQCHSSFTMTEGYAFDSLEGSRAALKGSKLSVSPGSTGDLLFVLDGVGYEQMPPDVPLATEDREYLVSWIVDANAAGL